MYQRLTDSLLEGAHDASVDADATRLVVRSYWQHLVLVARRFSDGNRIFTRREPCPQYPLDHVRDLIDAGAEERGAAESSGEALRGGDTPEVEHHSAEAPRALVAEEVLQRKEELEVQEPLEQPCIVDRVPDFHEDLVFMTSEIEDDIGVTYTLNEESHEAQSPSPKRQRLTDRHYEPFIVTRPCSCGKAATLYFDCQCLQAIQAQPWLRAELGVA